MVIFKYWIKIQDSTYFSQKYGTCWLPKEKIIFHLPQIFGESTYQINGTSYAPYTVDFIANDNVSAGDYDIPINYIYKYSGKWYQDTKIIKLHLNHWYETKFWQTILQSGAILGIILTIVLLLKELYILLNK